ncbi:hypothetical protein HYS96_00650 [Candidatus Daviesbacteria bacterium]|nr:hypothetical protein [Candidatus Daviesbacteria bacterium]
MNQNVKDLIGWLKLYGERETNSFTRFFFFYMCFDAWITAESQKDRDTEKLKWFLSNDNCLKDEWFEVLPSKRMTSLLNDLKTKSPVYDDSPNSNKKRELNNINNIEEVVWFIYQIRCNLFHGSKSPMTSRHASLVELSGLILEKWIAWAVLKCF